VSPPGAEAAVLRPGDRVRVAFDFARWVGRHPTAVLVVGSITRTREGVTILGLRWPPAPPRWRPGPGRGRVGAAVMILPAQPP
jgi:hypothetical protein